MPATVYPNQRPYTDTLDAGNALSVTVPVGATALVERKGPAESAQTLLGPGTSLFGPYQHTTQIKVSAFVAAAIVAEAEAEFSSFLAPPTYAIAFATAVPFRSIQADLGTSFVTGPLAFTVDAAGAVDGASAVVDVVANGANVPTFAAAFHEHSSSAGFVNTGVSGAGVINTLHLWRRAGTYFYSWSQAIDLVQTGTPAADPFVRLSNQTAVIESGDGTSGWSYVGNGLADSRGNSTVKIPNGSDGYFYCLGNPASGSTADDHGILGLSASNAAFYYYEAGCRYGIYGGANGDQFYAIDGGSPTAVDAVVTGNAGAIQRIRVQYSDRSIHAEVSKDGGATWLNVKTWTTAYTTQNWYCNCAPSTNGFIRVLRSRGAT